MKRLILFRFVLLVLFQLGGAYLKPPKLELTGQILHNHPHGERPADTWTLSLIGSANGTLTNVHDGIPFKLLGDTNFFKLEKFLELENRFYRIRKQYGPLLNGKYDEKKNTYYYALGVIDVNELKDPLH